MKRRSYIFSERYESLETILQLLRHTSFDVNRDRCSPFNSLPTMFDFYSYPQPYKVDCRDIPLKFLAMKKESSFNQPCSCIVLRIRPH